jgi:hypothetical protein
MNAGWADYFVAAIRVTLSAQSNVIHKKQKGVPVSTLNILVRQTCENPKVIIKEQGTMKLNEIVERENLSILTNIINRDVTGAFFSDLISDAMGQAHPGNLWITAQSHKNIVSAANLLDISAVIVPGEESIPQDSIELANRFRVVILSSTQAVPELARRFVNLGLKIKAESRYQEMLQEIMQTCASMEEPCVMYTSIFEAVENNDSDAVEKFLTQGISVNTEDETGATPVHWAAFHNLLELVELLVAKGANIYGHDHDGWTPLHWAKSRKMMEFLISQGADVNTRCQFGQTPLHLLSMSNYPDVIRFLISKEASVNVNEALGKTPLHFAASKNNGEIVEILISHGAQVDAKDNDGKTPLHMASAKGHKEVVEILARHKADCTMKDNDGKTPVDYARERNHKSLITFFHKKKGA